jgi:hypothetical protein
MDNKLKIYQEQVESVNKQPIVCFHHYKMGGGRERYLIHTIKKSKKV